MTLRSPYRTRRGRVRHPQHDHDHDMKTIDLKAIPAGATVISGDPTDVGAALFAHLVLPAVTVMHEKGGPGASMGAFAGLLAAAFTRMTELYGTERGAEMVRMAAESFQEAQAEAAAAPKH